MLPSLIDKWSFPIYGDTSTYFFTVIKSRLTAFHSDCTWWSIATEKDGERRMRTVTGMTQALT